MRSYLSDFNELSLAAKAADRDLAMDDWHREMGGVQASRISKHLSEDSRETATSTKRGGRSGEVLSALDLALMADPAYAELYNNTFDRLRDAEAATDRALMKAEEALADARAALDTTLDRAATLEDGTRVFKDADGQVWTEHGQMVDADSAAGIEWTGIEPAHETFLIRQQTFNDAQNDVSDLRGYQVRLGGYREQMMDNGHPVTEDDLKTIDRGIKEFAPPGVVSERAAGSDPVTAAVHETGFNLPNLDGS